MPTTEQAGAADKSHRMFSHAKWDTLGITASLLCAIHCVALPFFISTLPFLGIELLHNVYIEVTMICISFLAGCWALGFLHYKPQGRSLILLLFAVGMAVLLLSLFVGYGTAEITCKSIAALCIVTAHAFNLRNRARFLTSGKSPTP